MLSYLTASVREIVAVDLNGAHIALLNLKLRGLASLPDHAAFFDFFGRADATAFDAQAAFGVGGALHIVDFGDQGALPGWFRSALHGWLARFDVTPRLDLEAELGDLAATYRLRLAFRPLYRRYAFMAALQAN